MCLRQPFCGQFLNNFLSYNKFGDLSFDCIFTYFWFITLFVYFSSFRRFYLVWYSLLESAIQINNFENKDYLNRKWSYIYYVNNFIRKMKFSQKGWCMKNSRILNHSQNDQLTFVCPSRNFANLFNRMRNV